jgi:uncharacterized transporter YbjL
VIRLIVFALIILVANLGAFKLAATIGIAIDPRSYIFGLAVAVAVGYVWFKVDGWRGRVGRPSQPLTVTLQTKETPAQVTAAAIEGLFLFLLAVGVLVGLGYFLVKDAIH